MGLKKLQQEQKLILKYIPIDRAKNEETGEYDLEALFPGFIAGTGKTTFAAQFADNACCNGERCLYCAFEKASSQIIRNMRSTGLDLAPHRESGLLQFVTSAPPHMVWKLI